MKYFLNKLIFRLKNRTCRIERGVIVSRRARVGKNCILGKNCIISSNVVLGDNVRIGEGTRLRNIVIDDNTMIESGVKIVGPGKGEIVIGKECYIGVNNVLDTSDNISIGDFVHIAGPSTGLWCHSSSQMCMHNIPLHDKDRYRYRPTAPILIESNVYIGGNNTIYPGIKINHHSIVTPNSVVTKNVHSNTLVGGVPARKIKEIE